MAGPYLAMQDYPLSKKRLIPFVVNNLQIPTLDSKCSLPQSVLCCRRDFTPDYELQDTLYGLPKVMQRLLWTISLSYNCLQKASPAPIAMHMIDATMRSLIMVST